MPELSVIIPVYNTEKYLENCIESILNQTYNNYEIILVNDGSSDGSSRICDAYAEKYDCISVIHKENGGPVHTRQTGFRASKGKYISYIDSDDHAEPQMYQYMMDKIKKYSADIAVCGIMVDTHKKSTPLCNLVEDGFYNKERLEKELYPQMLFNVKGGMPGIAPSLCNKIIKREVLEKHLLNADTRVLYGEDALCSYPSMLDAQSIFVNNIPFYHYRQTGASIISGYDEELLNKFLILIDFLKKSFEEHNFNGSVQLNCYAARHTLECIRKELLYNKKKSLKQRIDIVNEYVEKPMLKQAFETAYNQNFDRLTHLKMKLVRKKQIFLLYLLFYTKNLFLRFLGV